MARLVVVPTPIGNLEDITLRALSELRSASLVLAEDTRHTRKLLTHFGIRKPLLSYHEHNRRSRLPRVLEALQTGDVALVSDAGTPGISDPGTELIAAAVREGVEVDVLPGPSAVITAVVLAAFGQSGFLFMGFLPRRAGERREVLERVASVPYPLVFYEAPHRLVQTLTALREQLGNRRAVVARELSKVHQEVLRGSLDEVLERYSSEPARGELTIVVGPEEDKSPDLSGEAFAEMRRRRAAGEERRTAVGAVSAKFGIGRNAAYRMWLEAGPGG